MDDEMSGSDNLSGDPRSIGGTAGRGWVSGEIDARALGSTERLDYSTRTTNDKMEWIVTKGMRTCRTCCASSWTSSYVRETKRATVPAELSNRDRVSVCLAMCEGEI